MSEHEFETEKGPTHGAPQPDDPSRIQKGWESGQKKYADRTNTNNQVEKWLHREK